MKPAPIDPPEIHHQLWEGFTGTVGYDIGANCGQTIPEMLGRFTEVYAFEPAIECWPYLEDLMGDDERLTFYPIAVSDQDGYIELVSVPDKIDTGQLVSNTVCGMEWSPDAPGSEARRVTSATIDSLLDDPLFERPSFMKIDTEGHEVKVLFGARKTLAVHRPDLLIEFHSPELREQCLGILAGYDYTVETVRHPHYTYQSDFWHQHGWLKAFNR